MKPIEHELKNTIVSTISMCTKRCWHCPYGTDCPPLPQVMPEKFVVKLIDELSDVSYSGRLTFYGINEPLLDPRIEDFVAYARKKMPDIRMTLTSNGDLATVATIGRLFKAGINKINLTLHYEKDRPHIMQLKESYPRGVVVTDHSKPETTAHFHNVGGGIKSNAVLQGTFSKGCAMPFRQMVLYPDCSLGLCCEGYSDKLRVAVSDEQKILDVYYKSELLSSYRKMLLSGERNIPPCSECSYSGEYNLPE